MKSRKLILYIASSLDGYIAKPGDDLSFLNRAQKEGEDYGYQDFMATVDTVIMGRRTYDWVMNQVAEFPHAGLETFIITRTARPPVGKVQFYTGSLPALVQEIKQKSGKNIFCDGGAAIANVLFKHNLIDEIILSVIPVILGAGVHLFEEGLPEQDLELMASKRWDTGLVQLHYRRIIN